MKKLCFVSPVFGILLIAVMCCFPTTRADSSIALTFIANKSVNVENMSVDEIRNIFLGQKVKWDDHSQIHVVCLSDGDVHREFVREFARRTPAQFQAWWRKLLFTGKGAMPRFFDTEQQMIEFIERTEGAIGYVGTSPDSRNVNIIAVER